ncbi:MAG: 1,4-alpha-glucan branching protein GlgB [Candidatus Promineofilum sp.]|nr:1,4-alpha-glucan branching protein GlgB [Promineifilum sp.]MCW5863033.1 1,4-alpha-glucan branching protein GlgB [Anaerolineae bacterium]
MSETLLDPGAIEAIVGGYHGAPFDILGPHRAGDDLVIRAFLPEAESVGVILGPGDPRPMERIHITGLFEVTLPNQDIAPYRLAVTDRSGQTQLYEDPYSFTSTFGGLDAYLMGEGTHQHIYERLGAHIMELRGVSGVHFAVWAPNAQRVSVVGPFNQWDGRRHPMRFLHDNGVWELFIPGLGEGTLYKYEIKTHYQGYMVSKADPVGFASEMRPKTASVVWDIDKHQWGDAEWMDNRDQHQGLRSPISIYELHIGSWRRKNGWEWLTYRDLITELIPYVKELGYTHIELLPVAEHPSDNSWGYQVTGFYAPTSRYGTPDDFMAFVDACHQAGIGVLVDWVPAHFITDEHGLGFFDGTHLYEHADPRLGRHEDWGTLIFNYGRNEVSQFLISNAVFWLHKYHIDGLRVDAVASMLYLDFSRKQGEWVANRYGGRENLEAVDFVRRFNDAVHRLYPTAITVAEESTSWPGVTRPPSEGGLGFDYKWNMGWMHDTLQYFKNEPVHRSYHHGTLTFSLLYAFSERFLLPFSHDEVVHLKRSMLDKMPGDVWQRFANLRLLYSYQWTHPGKKLLFMGGEFGQWREWNEAASLEWQLLDVDPKHGQLRDCLRRLNQLYTGEAALHEDDYSWEGFQWIDLHDYERSILGYARRAPSTGETVLVVLNFTPVPRHGYRLGVPAPGVYREIFNSDAAEFGGSGVVNEPRPSQDVPWHGQPQSIEFVLPPLGAVFLKRDE